MSSMFRTSFLMAFLWISHNALAEGPAVDGVNGKLSVQAGRSGGDNIYGVDGSLTFPLSYSLGAQIDLATSKRDTNHDDLNNNHIGGHLFWRDPDSALFGITAGYHDFKTGDLKRFGIEAESYMSNFTLRARAGYQKTNFDYQGFHASDSSGYVRLRGTYYATENLAFSAKIYQTEHATTGLDVEWLPGITSMPGASVFASLSHHQSANATSGLLGVRYYFGSSNKTLMKHHRTEDPDSDSFDELPNMCPSGYYYNYWTGGCALSANTGGNWTFP